MSDLSVVRQQLELNLAGAEGDARRIFHGRGRFFPGLEQVSIDYFQPVFLITLFAEVEPAWLDKLLALLRELAETGNVNCIAVQRRYLQAAPLQVLWGELPRKPIARERGLQFALQLGGRQNLGFFLDMAEARRWVAAHAREKQVLNLFSYTCAFSVVAREAGARQVVNLDMSAAALRQGEQNHQRNGLAGGVSFLAHDVFRSWGKLRRLGPFNLLVVDPPSRQPGSFVAEKDYPRLLSKISSLCGPGAEVLLCLNSPHLGVSFLTDAVTSHAPELDFVERLPNAQQFPDENSDLSLKVLRYVNGTTGSSSPAAS